MNMKKISAALISGAVAASVASFGVSAEDSFKAIICYTDIDWAFSEMGSYDNAVDVTGDGTYTITTTVPAGTQEIGVFCVDIEGMFAANPDATATLDSVQIDGADVSFDASKIVYGDIEEKGNYRIEIYNMYGTSKDDPGFNSATPINESLSVTFTVSGLGGAAAAEEEAPAETEAPAEEASEEVPASDNTTTAAATGNASVTVIAAVMAVAGAAMVISKRK